jgi:hypothetical protein
MPITKMLVATLSIGFGAQTGWNLGSAWGLMPGFLLANLDLAVGWYYGRCFVNQVFEG